jgi:proteasome lid subunit RPN8/RPN11
VKITADQHEQLLAHARDEAPNECCGYLKLRDGRVQEVVRLRNERQSPYGYTLDRDGLLAIMESEDEGFDIGIYHSHPRSAAEPSQMDLNAAEMVTWLQLIISLDGTDRGEHVRAWHFGGGQPVEEEEIVVE